MSSVKPFGGRVALVTGTGGGIERAIAEQLGAAGAAVAVVAQPTARADAAVESIRAAGGEAHAFAADLADPESVPALVHGIERVFGEIDILVNHAATVAPLGPVSALGPAAVLRALTVNVACAVALAGAVIPSMSRQGWGRIANVCGSVGHLVSWPGGNIYAACVAALEAHSLNLAEELTGTGVTVNVLRAQWAGTALRTWLTEVDPDAVDDPLIRRFIITQTGIGTVDSGRSAATLLDHLITTRTGHVVECR